MNLSDLLTRQSPPLPWSEGDNIPWYEPGFSRRMLKEHLTQQHDAASRRSAVIDRHVAWIWEHALARAPGRVLDLGCGPGLYASRLAGLGCTCLGVDYSPASIEYAREQAQREGLRCTYQLADLREADFGGGHDLAMLIYGEFNVFRPADIRTILRKARAALKPGGWLLLEPHTFEAVRQIGRESGWYTSASGLFSEQPYLVLTESFWDEPTRAVTVRHFVVQLPDGKVERFAQSLQAYTQEEYCAVLEDCGFRKINFHADFGEDSPSLFIILAQV